MSNLMPVASPSNALSDETLVKRLFDLALAGDDGSEEFLRLDAECQRRMVRANAAPMILRSLTIPSGH